MGILDILKFLDGKKTYIIAVVGALIGLAQAFNVSIPEWVLTVLGALGLGTVRAAVGKVGK